VLRRWPDAPLRLLLLLLLVLSWPEADHQHQEVCQCYRGACCCCGERLAPPPPPPAWSGLRSHQWPACVSRAAAAAPSDDVVLCHVHPASPELVEPAKLNLTEPRRHRRSLFPCPELQEQPFPHPPVSSYVRQQPWLTQRRRRSGLSGEGWDDGAARGGGVSTGRGVAAFIAIRWLAGMAPALLTGCKACVLRG
jgi:hypothetical protein